jgi:hypothetical protein
MVLSATPAKVTPSYKLLRCMKEPQEVSAWLIRLLSISAALLLAAGCATEVPFGNDGVPSAKVVRLKGAARYKTGSMAWQGLKTGDSVKPGTIIETANKSRLDLVLGAEMLSYHPNAEQNRVRLWENSRMGIDKITVMGTGAEVVTETRLDLQAGQIFGKVRMSSGASTYEVKIPNAVARIRGAVYDISVEGVVQVLSGSVELVYPGPDGKMVRQVIRASGLFDRKGNPQ